MKVRFFILFSLPFLSFEMKAQLPKWILGSSLQNASGTFYTYGTGNIKFYEVNFNGVLSSAPRTLGATIQSIQSMGTQDVMQTAVDTASNTVQFYAFVAAVGAWNGGFPAISPDTVYFAAYDPSTMADEVFGKVPTTGWGASVIESELVKKPGSSSEYYFIYKTQATSNFLDYIRYVKVDFVNKTVSSPINIITTARSGEGMAVSRLNCNNQRWLFVTRPESNGDITLRRSAITNTGITPAADIYTITIPGNLTNVVAGVEIAPTNNYLAVANYNATAVSKNMVLFDYNNATGSVSNERYYHNQSNNPFVTMEFSPNGSRVYILQGGSGSIPNIIYNCPVSANNYTVSTADQLLIMPNQCLSLETAYDGKIYVNPGQSSGFMHIINNPNSATPTLTATGTNFFGPNDRIGPAFPDQVDGDRLPVISVNVSANSTALCAGQTATLTASGGTSYQWSGGSTATSDTILVSPTNTSTYVVTVSDGTCTASDSLIVQVSPTPTVSVSANQVICPGQTTTLTASGANSYQWSGGSTATASVITVNPLATTTYIVTGITGSCTGQDSVVVQVAGSPTVLVTGNLTLCPGQTTTLTAAGGTSYQWSGGSSATAPQITVSPSVTTTYSVTATSGGCTSAPAVVTVTVAPTLSVTITASTTTLCTGQTATLTASGGTVYQWSGGSTATSPVIIVSPTVSTAYTVTADNNGCSGSASITLPVTQFAPSQFTWSISNCIPPEVHFSNLSAAGAYWDFGDGGNSTSNYPAHTYASGTYTVSMITNAGTQCADTSTQVISTLYEQVPVIPNVFTPNDDGINDKLVFSGLDSCSEYRLAIYNRWGQKIFETNAPRSVFWNGGLNGNNADDGTYFYLLEPAGSEKQAHKGYILLIR